MLAYIYAPATVGGMFMSEPFGEFLRREREESGLTLQEVAGRLDMSHATIQRYETGKRDVDFPVALQIADALGIPRRRATEAWILSHGGDKTLLPTSLPEIEREPDEEYLQESIMAYNGPNPILSASAATARSMKQLFDNAGPELTGDEPKEVIVRGRGPRKGIQKVDK